MISGEIYYCTTEEGVDVAVKVERVCKPGNLKEEELILAALKGSLFTCPVFWFPDL